MKLCTHNFSTTLKATSSTSRIQCAARYNVNKDLGEGPGSGRRHFPEYKEDDKTAGSGSDRFPLLSAQEMEALFPKWVHASTPPPSGVLDREPAGLTALRDVDAGPTTGHRRRPSFLGSMPESSSPPPVLPYPTTGPAADLKRDLDAKKRILKS